jgi:transposase
LVYKCPFDISVICTILGLPYNKFYRWFKECLTDFKTEEGQARLHQYDFQVTTGSGYKNILVPIFRPEHFDYHMAIDEKHINSEFYTVLTNAKTGKVALLCSTIKVDELKICLNKFDPLLLDKVAFMTLDLSPTFGLVVTNNFPNAIQIADKFHVIKNGIEYLQAIRIRLKQEELKTQREQQAIHNKNYTESKSRSLIGPKMKISKTYYPERLSNGETLPELLSRSRYLLVISPDKRNEYQMKRAQLLFEKYPQLKQALQAITDFRAWYKSKPNYFEPFENERTLGNWIDEVENSPYSEMKNFRNLVTNHEQRIMNYHRYGNKTNAIAESVNAKIKESIRQNKGSRDLDFFHFRIAIII